LLLLKLVVLLLLVFALLFVIRLLRGSPPRGDEAAFELGNSFTLLVAWWAVQDSNL
jgi:hypothetical protein